jgi:hypothetical protein
MSSSDKVGRAMASLHEGYVTRSFPPSLRSGTTMSAESTRKLLGNLFELQDLGAQDLKGIGNKPSSTRRRLMQG